MKQFRLSILAVLAGLQLFASGCLPAEADFEWGFSTDQVVGSVVLSAPGAVPDEALIVVYRRHYLLETLGFQDRIYTTTARLEYVDREGFYSIPMPSDVVSMHILFFAAEHLTREFNFERQIGIGRVFYRAELPHHPNWRQHFFTYLQPTLSDLIVEDRYRLPQDEQLRLGEWIQAQQARLLAQSETAPETAPETPPDAASEPALSAEPPTEPEEGTGE